MIVHPDYQSRGIATSLLERGLEEVDRAGQDVYLIATPTGRSLYHRCGFEDLEELHLNGLKNYKMLAMIRRHSP